jgi:hypothetical protein
MKGRGTWLELGDQKKKLFHKFTNHKKSTNTIWGITNEEGS